MPSYPYLNRGMYEWIPDEFGATSESEFNVIKAYYQSVVDFGRPQNALPLIENFPVYAHRTDVIGYNSIDVKNKKLYNNIEVPSSINHFLCSPFLRKLMRGASRSLSSLPLPDVNSGIGLSSSQDSCIFFSTNHIGNLQTSAISIEYALLTGDSQSQETPIWIYGIFDKNDVGPWLNMGRSVGENSTWGPPSQQLHTNDIEQYIDVISNEYGWEELSACPLPLWVRDSSGGVTSSHELAITHPGRDTNGDIDWDITDRRETLIKTSGTHWSINEYFPRLKGILIAPSPNASDRWKLIVSGLRSYDAVPCNSVPSHISGGKEVESQMPCKIFGYAWRISHPVLVSNTSMSAVQPMPSSRSSTFYFRLYNPDNMSIGLAHGVRFYYLLVALRIHGTSPMFGGGSLVGTIGAMSSDTDLMMIQYAGLMAGVTTLSFSMSNLQHTTPRGRTVYGGMFRYPSNTVALKCFRQNDSTSVAPLDFFHEEWSDIGSSFFPSSNMNGVKPLWYDDEGDVLNWYTILPLNTHSFNSFHHNQHSSYEGEFSPFFKSHPRTDVYGDGSFIMNSTSSGSTHHTSEATVCAKPACISTNELSRGISSFCNNYQKSHIATFVSGVHGGSDIEMYPGNWRVLFSAKVDDNRNYSSNLFLRFGIIPEDVDLSQTNGQGVWDHSDVVEFKFLSSVNGELISIGEPNVSELMFTPPLSDRNEVYDMSWFLYGGALAKNQIEESGKSSSDKTIRLKNISKKGSYRIVLQIWSVCYSKNNKVVNPESEENYPTITLSWGGDVKSVFQTTIIETKSNAILPQQDVSVTSLLSNKYFTIVGLGSGINTSTTTSSFRDYPLFKNNLKPNVDKIPSPLKKSFKILREDEESDDTSFSINSVVVNNRKNLGENQAQIIDSYIVGENNNNIQIGATPIPAQSINVNFDWQKNQTDFDANLSIELIAVADNGSVLFTIGSSKKEAMYGNDGKVNTTVNINHRVHIPNPNALMAIRIKVWAYENGNRPLSNDDYEQSKSFDNRYRGIDISNFKMFFENGIDIIESQTQEGNKDWFLGLPVSSPLTFGGSEYTFVPDKSSTMSSIVPPATVSGSSGVWTLDGWMFSPFWMEEMPYGSVFEIKDTSGLSGTRIDGLALQSLRVRTAIGTIPSISASAIKESSEDKGHLYIASNITSQDDSDNNQIRTIEYSNVNSLDERPVERTVSIGNSEVEGKNPLLISISSDTPVKYSNYKNHPYKYMFYEDVENDGGVNIISDYGTNRWKTPSGTIGADEKYPPVLYSNKIKMVDGCMAPDSNILHIVGYSPYDSNNPHKGGAILTQDISSTMIRGVGNIGASGFKHIGGISSQNEEQLDSEDTMMAAESFPSIHIDENNRIYVFYTLLTTNENEAKTALGKIFCRESVNGGINFGEPFPVVDLGYNTARSLGLAESNDKSFEIKSVFVAQDNYNKNIKIIYWAGGKLFMKTHVSLHENSLFKSPSSLSENMGGSPSLLTMGTLMIAGNIEFTSGNDTIFSNGLNKWLSFNWNNGIIVNHNSIMETNYTSKSITEELFLSKKGFPCLFLTKYANESDIPMQRAAASISNDGRMLYLFYLDSFYRVLYKKITLSEDADVNVQGFPSGSNMVGPSIIVNPLKI